MPTTTPGQEWKVLMESQVWDILSPASSPKNKQGKMGSEELGQLHLAAIQRGTWTTTVMGKWLKRQMVLLYTYLIQTSPEVSLDLV